MLCRSRIVSALTTLLCILIPILRVLINVFPFTPNRWFGLGFALYYVLCTPLLYKVGASAAHVVTDCRSPAAARILCYVEQSHFSLLLPRRAYLAVSGKLLGHARWSRTQLP